ncbi:MAG TPA: MFS transporter [Amycolatopsis sp.]|jgi:MFS family permease
MQLVGNRFSWAAVLCWLTVLIEGFDLVALGATSLALQHAGGLEFTPSRLTTVATVSLVGVALGAALVTPLADLVGRRTILIASVASFSAFTLVLPLSSGFVMFAVLRLLAGLGLGSCMPTALAMMSEHRPARRRTRASTTTMTGYHCGAVLASLLALAAGNSWQILFYAGGAAGLVIAAVMWWKLPETAPARRDAETERVTVLDLVRPRFLRTTLAVWVSTFMGLLLVYGLNTWLPSLMKTAGYGVSTSITLLFVLNAGGIAGMLLAGYVGDARGIRRTALAWFAVGAVLVAVLSIRIQVSVVLNLVIFLTGVFVFSAQVLVYAYVAQSYPDRIRGAALGVTSGVGRLGAITGPLITGVLVTAGVAYPWGFYFFAVAAVLGLLAMALAPRGPAPAPVA